MNQPCSICERGNVPVKPDHIGGRLRGHLCASCSNLLAYMTNNAWWLGQALNYLGYTISR